MLHTYSAVVILLTLPLHAAPSETDDLLVRQRKQMSRRARMQNLEEPNLHRDGRVGRHAGHATARAPRHRRLDNEE